MSMTTELAQRTDLLIANALETAKQLRELQESPVAEAIFESVVENENGKEIQFERPISDLAYTAFLKIERLAEALEARDKQIAELVAGRLNLQRTMGVYVHAYEEAKEQIAKDVQIKARLCRESNSLRDRLRDAEKRIAELEAKLAVPVKLPKTNGYWTEQEKAFEEGITLAKRQIRLSGFLCEGDE